jgi:hypothetical protein
MQSATGSLNGSVRVELFREHGDYVLKWEGLLCRRRHELRPFIKQRRLIEAASGCWCIRPFFELDAATGARRGEVLGPAMVGLRRRRNVYHAIAIADEERARVQGYEDRRAQARDLA